MRVPRFFVPVHAIDQDKDLIILGDRSIIDQLANVLRLTPGSRLDFLDGRGKLYQCSIVSIGGASRKNMPELQARIDDVLELAKDSEVEISIALPILRPSRFEWSLEKLTELGVNEIVPLSTERSVPRENKGSRWQSILRESAQQCERAYIPDLLEPMCLGEYLKHSSSGEDSAIFICAERSGDSAILKTRSALHAVLCNSPHKAPHKISVIVGAEGGFTLSELMLAEKLGAKPVSLGKRMLRSETAAVYAAAVVQAVLG